ISVSEAVEPNLLHVRVLCCFEDVNNSARCVSSMPSLAMPCRSHAGPIVLGHSRSTSSQFDPACCRRRVLVGQPVAATEQLLPICAGSIIAFEAVDIGFTHPSDQLVRDLLG